MNEGVMECKIYGSVPFGICLSLIVHLRRDPVAAVGGDYGVHRHKAMPPDVF